MIRVLPGWTKQIKQVSPEEAQRLKDAATAWHQAVLRKYNVGAQPTQLWAA